MAAKELTYFSLYRGSTVGKALTDSLDELIQRNEITPQLALIVLAQYDKVTADALASKVKTRATFKGRMKTFKFVDDVWQFYLKEVNFKIDNQDVPVTEAKIIACNAKSSATASEST